MTNHDCMLCAVLSAHGAEECDACTARKARCAGNTERRDRNTERPPCGLHEADRESMLRQAEELERTAECMMADAKALRVAAFRALGASSRKRQVG